ncbi:MAG: sulfurtransferase [Chloroflexi bacterium]|nr:sulfurtransferase [Chloroflexota bacterium]
MLDTLVSTAWVADQLAASSGQAASQTRILLLETSSTRLDGYAAAHIPGALVIDWLRDLVDRDDESSGLVIDPQRFAALASSLGIRPNDTLIFYGDMGGRHAARALWTFEYYRHPGDLHLMDGGREAWQREGRPMTADVPNILPARYPLPPAPDGALRATRDDIAAAIGSGNFVPLDTRTRDEYDARDIRAARGGRIPGAQHIFWKDNVAEDATFKSKAELTQLYAAIPRDATVATYCQLGMRAAHTWFVLRHVLGYPNVRNYDGSWQEWGNESETIIENETAP